MIGMLLTAADFRGFFLLPGLEGMVKMCILHYNTPE